MGEKNEQESRPLGRLDLFDHVPVDCIIFSFVAMSGGGVASAADTVRIGYTKNAGDAALYIAEAKDYFRPRTSRSP